MAKIIFAGGRMMVLNGFAAIQATQAAVSITGLAGVPVSATTATFSFSINRIDQPYNWVINTSPTAVAADCVNSNSLSGTQGLNTSTLISGLIAATIYYVHMYYNGTDGASAVVSSASFTTPAVTANVAPTVITPTSFSFPENTPAGTVIGVITSPGAVPTATFSEITDTSNKFSINAAGAITLTDAAGAGAYSYTPRASNTPGAGTGTFDQLLTMNATVVGAGDGAADATVSDITALRAKLAEWNGGPPAGKTNANDWIIDLAAGDWGHVSLTGYSHPVGGNIIIRSANWPGIGAIWRSFSGVNLTRVNLKFIDGTWGAGSQATGGAMFAGDNCQFCGIYNSRVIGTVGVGVENPQNIGIEFGTDTNNTNNYTIQDNYIEGFTNAVSLRGSDWLCKGNYQDRDSSDGFKFRSGSNGQMIDNWGHRFPNIFPGAHSDFSQLGQSGTHTNGYRYGNVFMQGNQIQQAQQGFFGGGTWIGGQSIQNIMFSGHTALMEYVGNHNCTYNLTARLTGTGSGTYFGTIGTGGVKDFNAVANRSGGSDGGAGTNGYQMNLPQNCTTAQYNAAYSLLFDGPQVWDYTAQISSFKPRAGARLHHNHANPCGPWLKLYEMFVLGKHPGRALGPIAAAWNVAYNADGYLT